MGVHGLLVLVQWGESVHGDRKRDRNLYDQVRMFYICGQDRKTSELKIVILSVVSRESKLD